MRSNGGFWQSAPARWRWNHSTVTMLAVLVLADLASKALAEDNIVIPKDFLRLNKTSGLHPCNRECIKDDNRICYYHYIFEYYYTLSMACHNCPQNLADCYRPDCVSADGHKRGLVLVNRQMPGPPIELCVGDRLVVDVDNQLGSDTTSVHWHGVHQTGTPHMDGVPHVTQCAIPPGAVFRYDFLVDKPGTHFWHSHSGFQRSDGAYGSLIAREPITPDQEQYEDIHTLLLSDWIHQLAVERFAWHHHSDGTNKPESILINGRGRPAGHFTNDIYPPLEELVVRENTTYRIRLISNGVMNCPLQVSVDNHDFRVIASDGVAVEPMWVDSLVIYAGERYDILLTAERPLVGPQRPLLHWIRVVGLMDCDERFTSAHQVAVLRYEDDNTAEIPSLDDFLDVSGGRAELEGSGESEGVVFDWPYAPESSANSKYPQPVVTYANSKNIGKKLLSPLNVAEHNESMVPVTVLNSTESPSWDLARNPDKVFYIDYDFNEVENPFFHHPTMYSVKDVAHHIRMLTPQFNNITMKLPVAPPLSQPEDTSDTCDHESLRRAGLDCTKQFCHCTHVLEVPLHSTAEVFLIDRGFAYDANHPLHMHGHSFYVVGMEKLGSTVTRQEVMERDRAGLVPRNLVNPPLKDTVTVPDGGYTLIRFHADNPGWWLFHCHMNFHAEVGMSVIFKVGEQEEMPKPPEGFPRCGGFMPHPKYRTGSRDGATVPESSTHARESLRAGIKATGAAPRVSKWGEFHLLAAVVSVVLSLRS